MSEDVPDWIEMMERYKGLEGAYTLYSGTSKSEKEVFSKFKRNPYTSVVIGDLPPDIQRGDVLYECGCIERDGKLWCRMHYCKYHAYPGHKLGEYV